MNFLNVHIFTWIGIVLIAVGTLFTFLGQQVSSDKSTKEISDKADQIRLLTQQTITLSTELSNMAKKNADMSYEITQHVTGGNSFCYLMPMPDQISDRQSFLLLHQGKYPLYDVVVEIENRSEMKNLTFEKLYREIIASHQKDVTEGRQKQRDLSNEIDTLRNSAIMRFPIGTLSPNTAVTLDRFPIQSTDKIDFFVKIITRNSYFTQTISEKKFGAVWVSSWRVLRHEKDGKHTIIEENINKDVPLID